MAVKKKRSKKRAARKKQQSVDLEGVQAVGANAKADFSLKLHRGDGMVLIAMNWKKGRPPTDFVGFAIEYREPKGDRFFTLKNRLSFETDVSNAETGAARKFSTKIAPIQKFRWTHFPRNAHKEGEFTYRVTPVFMNDFDELSYGEAQTANIRLARDTYPRKLNIAFTRGFIVSQAFADRYKDGNTLKSLLPPKHDAGLDFTPTHTDADNAYRWMGFEAREQIFKLLADAKKDKAEVFVIAYELSLPEILEPLEALGKKLKIIIDNSAKHGEKTSAESKAAKRLIASAGKNNVIRQKMGGLQHNKVIIVDGKKVNKVLCGSTNFSWRGFYVQSNNAMILSGAKPVTTFRKGFDDYWENEDTFKQTNSADWMDLGLTNIDAKVSFSPHAKDNAALSVIADDIKKAKSSIFYSLAFLSQTKGIVAETIKEVTNKKDLFVYGISDRKTKIVVEKPDGNLAPVFVAALSKKVPEPFKSEAKGGGGNRMHHKFVVIDFDKPTARVYFGSYNFSKAADLSNGENLLVIRDRRVATSYMIEALRLFDHYHFRTKRKEAREQKTKLVLRKPPRKAVDKSWWLSHYTNKKKTQDRKLFA